MSGNRDTISLTKAQQEAAKEILEQLSDDEVETPHNILNNWETVDERYDNYPSLDDPILEDVEWEWETEYIPVSKVMGTTKGSSDHLMERRLRNILDLLLAGEFEWEYEENPPKLEKVGDHFYVAIDGTHRVIAFKALGLEKIYSKYYEIPLL